MPAQHAALTTPCVPEFRGGEKELMMFVAKNTVYPPTALKDSTMGKVMVTFEIDSIVKVVNPKIVRGVRKDLNDEALRVVSLIPNFLPCKPVNGKYETAKYTLPFIFKL